MIRTTPIIALSILRWMEYGLWINTLSQAPTLAWAKFYKQIMVTSLLKPYLDKLLLYTKLAIVKFVCLTLITTKFIFLILNMARIRTPT
jgi:hypothetical protein